LTPVVGADGIRFWNGVFPISATGRTTESRAPAATSRPGNMREKVARTEAGQQVVINTPILQSNVEK